MSRSPFMRAYGLPTKPVVVKSGTTIGIDLSFDFDNILLMRGHGELAYRYRSRLSSA